jgi:hypothetical protein
MDGWGWRQAESLPNKDAEVDWSTKLEGGPATVISLVINTFPSDERNPVFAKREIGWCTTVSYAESMAPRENIFVSQFSVSMPFTGHNMKLCFLTV